MTSTLKDSITRSFFAGQQEMVLTLPRRLLMAFSSAFHQKYIDPQTNMPFASFYRWLMASPPPGCGLAGSQYMDAGDIIHHLEKCRGRLPESEKGPLNDLIEELVKGYGEKKPAGRPKKDNPIGADQIIGRGASKANHASTLAARMAESSDPKIHKAWEAFLAGKHPSVTRAAIVCGIVKDAHQPLKRLKQYWLKATRAEREEFLKFIQEENTPKLRLAK